MKIHAIQTGVVHVKSDFLRGSVAAGGTLPFLLKCFTDKAFVDLPIYAWAIEHDEGVIVVDTGDIAAEKKSFITQSTFTIAPQEQIGAQLRHLGFAPGDITKVVLTHTHADHANGVVDFPNTPILLGEAEYKAHKTAFGGFFNRLTNTLPKWFDPQPMIFEADSSLPFERAYPLTKAGDVIAVPTPGHTGGHTSVIARIDGISYFMAGDVTYDEQALIEQKFQGPTITEAGQRQTLARVLAYTQAQPTIYLPAHDWESGKRLTEKRIVPMGIPATAVSS